MTLTEDIQRHRAGEQEAVTLWLAERTTVDLTAEDVTTSVWHGRFIAERPEFANMSVHRFSTLLGQLGQTRYRNVKGTCVRGLRLK